MKVFAYIELDVGPTDDQGVCGCEMKLEVQSDVLPERAELISALKASGMICVDVAKRAETDDEVWSKVTQFYLINLLRNSLTPSLRGISESAGATKH